MKTRCLLLLCITLPLFAQDVDLAVTVTADSHEPRLVAEYGVHVKWDAAEAPANVVLTIDVGAPVTRIYKWDAAMECSTEGTRIRCTLPSVTQFDGGAFVTTEPRAPGIYTAEATVTSTTPDPRSDNNRASASIDVTGLPLLRAGGVAEIEFDNAVDPARPATLRTGMQNSGETATDAVMRVTLPEGGSFVRIDESTSRAAVSCSLTPQEVVCRWPVLPMHDLNQFRITYLPPDRDDGGTFPVRFSGVANEDPAEKVYVLNVPIRTRFRVTNAADDGSGSLRQAMRDASAGCAATPCLIAVRAPEPIRLLSPLPELSGFVKIDGEEAHALLDGSLLADGHALSGAVCELRVSNLRVYGFPGHAIDARQATECAPLRQGVHIRNSDLSRNLRGIVVKTLYAEMTNNVIRDNQRAGIFIEGSFSAIVTGNEITGNGASGIFLNLRKHTPFLGWPSWARITGNVIRSNREWGVSRTTNGFVQVTENAIGDNHLYAMDVGLDLGTPNHDDDKGLVPNKPALLSASYDPVTNRTTVRMRADNTPYGGLRVDFYASNSLSTFGYPDAETWVASKGINQTSAVFEAELPGDQRGKWITATTTRTLVFDWELTASDTSELSDALQVQ